MCRQHRGPSHLKPCPVSPVLPSLRYFRLDLCLTDDTALLIFSLISFPQLSKAPQHHFTSPHITSHHIAFLQSSPATGRLEPGPGNWTCGCLLGVEACVFNVISKQPALTIIASALHCQPSYLPCLALPQISHQANLPLSPRTPRTRQPRLFPSNVFVPRLVASRHRQHLFISIILLE